MHYSFQWRLLLFWSVLFSSVCYGHGLSRVRTLGFGFALAHELIPDGFHFGEAHAFVAMELATRVATDHRALHQNGQGEHLDRETCALPGRQIGAIISYRVCTCSDRVQPPVMCENIAGFDFVRFDDYPVAMRSLAQFHRSIAAESAELNLFQWIFKRPHSKLDVRTTSCFNEGGLVFFSLFAFSGDTIRTPMVRTLRVLHAPACCFSGVVGGGTAWKIGRRRFDGEGFQERLQVKDSLRQELNTRLAVFVHETITAATQNATRHARHYSPARARKQAPPVPVLLSSAKTKNIAILNSDRYTLLREVERLNHRNAVGSNGGSDPSLEMCGVDQWQVSRPHKPKVAGSSPCPRNHILIYPTTRRNGQSGSAEQFRNHGNIQAEGVKGVEVERPPDLLAGVGKSRLSRLDSRERPAIRIVYVCVLCDQTFEVTDRVTACPNSSTNAHTIIEKIVQFWERDPRYA